MSARISVVVPVYNVADYLELCLESLAQQTMASLEIVMVDDGSTDDSIEIAERFVARDPRFRIVHQANAGLGAARNTGVAHAAGELLAFVDSDDVVPHHAYELLSDALDRSGSDFASGNVRRLTSAGTKQAAFLAAAFERTRLGVHISLFPTLLADRTAWNKLFRRSFWDRHGLRFPEGVFYEDTPVTLPAHFLAKSVDVIAQPVYLWRMREGADLSITQRRTDPKMLRDRVAAVDHVSRFLAERGYKSSKSRYDRTVVAYDMRFFLDVFPSADDEYRRLFLDLANDFLDRADRRALDLPRAIDRLKWQLVRRRALAELLDVLRFQDEELHEVPPVRRARRWYGDYPYRTDTRLKIPERVYRLDSELRLVARVDELRWQGDLLRIEGHAYIEAIGAAQADSQEVELALRGPGRRLRPLKLHADPVLRPDVTAGAGQQLAGLDWSGFVATLDAKQLRREDRWQVGRWDVEIAVRAGGVTRKSRRFEAAPWHPLPSARSTLQGNVHLRAGVSSGGQLTVDVERKRAIVRSCLLEKGVLQLEGDVGPVEGTELTLLMSRSGGTAVLEYPVHVDRFGPRPTFLARIPVGDLVREIDVADQVAHVEQQAEGVPWNLRLAGSGRPRALRLDEATPKSVWAFHGREIALQRTRSDNVRVVERSFRPVVTRVEWTREGALLLGGSFRGPADEYDLVLSSRWRRETYAFPLNYEVETGRFRAEVRPGSVTAPAGTRPLGHGSWEILVRRRGKERADGAGIVLDDALLDELPTSARIGLKRFHLGVVGVDTPILAVERDLDDDERGGFAQRRLRTSFYPSQRGRSVNDVVLYDCFDGRAYSDSPRAIHEELVRRDAPFDHLWVVHDSSFQVPKTAVAIRKLSEEYYEAFARARYVVSNDYWPRWFDRRSEQICVQTWHGAPLKRLGYDLADRPRAVREFRRVLSQRAGNWQYVVSPGPYATSILRSAFPVAGEVLETGLPRTDMVVRPDRDRIGEEVRRFLGLPAGKRVVLYAPTYRDHLAQREGYRLGPLPDFAAMRSALGDDYVVLFRKHPMMVAAPDLREGLVDVSWFPDANELLLAADVLLTDYSSLVFDFAGTGRPMVFFTPDLDAYRDEIRGFSIDFEAHAPGPLLSSTDDVIESLRQPDDLAAGYRERYDAFRASYCPLDDGRASARVVDRVFSW